MTAPTPALEARALSKTYRVPVRAAGIGAALRSLFRREHREVEAVKDLSFSIEPGEIVGFLGPNGAGKTTALKMMSGLLHPSGGEVRVLGFEPFQRQKDFLRQITLVMGQRNQLIWDIPVADSFDRNRAIYRIPQAEFDAIRSELTELLDLGDLLEKPVRNLSLGERMKCEVAAALLHRPQVLFLDEPTLGLDVTMQRRIREFVQTYNERTGATVLLTSHYMADVEALCKRVVVIHRGQLLFDGLLSDLVERFSAEKTIVVELQEAGRDLELGRLSEVARQVEREGQRVTLRAQKESTPEVTARLLDRYAVADLSVEDPPIEDVIEQVFASPGTTPDNASIDTEPGTADSPLDPESDPSSEAVP